MSMTAVPISMRLVLAPTAARRGKGDESCRAKWCTRKYAPSAPSCSAATASSIDCWRTSRADRTADWYDVLQWPKERNPIFFTARAPCAPPEHVAPPSLSSLRQFRPTKRYHLRRLLGHPVLLCVCRDY